ncbi:MAG: hypothetical protein HY704_11875 [Gemmatimonadetes bacterium]|nr:hypothetical protein [Gemmatimonadota bacterium]
MSPRRFPSRWPVVHSQRSQRSVWPLAFAALALAACDITEPLDEAAGRRPPDALRGQAAFVASCSGCHASGDGLDLAYFRFTDTTVVRRAVAHVDTATALDIVAYIHTLDVRPANRDVRLFQPGGSVLASDVAFAHELFGGDRWAADLTTERLQAIDPLHVKVAVPFPLWSIEKQNVDWMPDDSLPRAILDDQGALVRGSIGAYRAAPTVANLVRAVSAVRSAARRIENPGAPCVMEDSDRVDYQKCFQVRRWASTLVAQHMIRTSLTGRIDPTLHDVWWDVGDAVRQALSHAFLPFENGRELWASWMYLGWAFEPTRHASVYTGRGLVNVGLARHATFLALRSAVARPKGSTAPYEDVSSAATFAPAHWTLDAVRFGFNHLLERLAASDRPARAEQVITARQRVVSALELANRKVGPADRATLQQLAQRVLAALPER